MKRVLGLDMGVASVGWGIIDEDTNNIVDSGVRLFDSRDASQNEERRNFRGGRRLNRRRKTRVSDMKKLLENAFNIDVIPKYTDILELRNKGLKDKLSKDEISACIIHIIKRRGITYLDDADDGGTNDSEFSKSLEINRCALKEKFPCEIQLERLKKEGKYRGLVESSGAYLQNIFTTSSYAKELTALLNNQGKYHQEITQELIESILEILNRKRKYYDGPGTLKSPSNYGKFKIIDNKVVDVGNIFAELIGKCSIYPEELRASGASYTAQLFNFLNDINNLSIPDVVISRADKVEIIEKIKGKNSFGVSHLITLLKNKYKIEESDIKGFRIDKDDKNIFHLFETYRKLQTASIKAEINISKLTIEEYDEIANILTLNTEKEGILDAISKSEVLPEKIKNDSEVINFLINFRKKNSSSFKKWQSLSFKAMKEIEEELFDTNDNQSTIFHRMGKFKTNIEKYAEYKYIPSKEILKDIYNPIAQRSANETIKIVNALLKKYGHIDKIVIEMPREYISSKDAKDKINTLQRKNEMKLQNIIKMVKEEYGVNITDDMFYKHKGLVLKLKLWDEQDQRCLYSGKKIFISELINDKSMFDIDHILPISKSFDDSFKNKVLVYSDENRKKSNNTPYYYFKSYKTDNSWTYDDFKKSVLELQTKKKIDKRKVNNFLFEEDINKYEVLKGFISRNLNDTRYSARVILNSFTDFFNSKKSDNKTVVKVVSGAYTNQFRKRLRLDKDRDESFAHHGVDALICAYSYLGATKYLKDSLNIAEKEDGTLLNYETGEIFSSITDLKRDELSKIDYEVSFKFFTNENIRKGIFEAEKNMKYSHKVDRKVNRSISNQTIYSTRKFIEGKKNDLVNHAVSKYNNIYDDKDYKRFKTRYDKDQKNPPENSMFLMRRYDPKTFETLEKIMKFYDDKDIPNPFRKYKEENNDYIRKYCKKQNKQGAPIKQIKFLDSKVNSCIKLHEGEDLKRDVILRSINPFRSDVYLDLEKNEYRLIGLSHKDFKFYNGSYGLNKLVYNQTLIKEKLIKEDEYFEDLLGTKIQFVFTLYKNDVFQYESKGELHEYRFLSRTKPDVTNYMEVKPTYKKIYTNEDGTVKRMQIPFEKKVINLKKVNTDILGNKHFLKSEEFRF